MRLGTRWRLGGEAPAAMPAPLRAAIRDFEERLRSADEDGLDSAHWTLTWLEGRPVAELDTGARLSLDAAGGVVTELLPEED